jgi:hypothetical protein
MEGIEQTMRGREGAAFRRNSSVRQRAGQRVKKAGLRNEGSIAPIDGLNWADWRELVDFSGHNSADLHGGFAPVHEIDRGLNEREFRGWRELWLCDRHHFVSLWFRVDLDTLADNEGRASGGRSDHDGLPLERVREPEACNRKTVGQFVDELSAKRIDELQPESAFSCELRLRLGRAGHWDTAVKLGTASAVEVWGIA